MTHARTAEQYQHGVSERRMDNIVMTFVTLQRGLILDCLSELIKDILQYLRISLFMAGDNHSLI